MAVNIDTVYQRVLAIANKEQRGYITPQEFNLLANQVQMAMYEDYFYALDEMGERHGNDTEYADRLDNLNEKISIFSMQDVALANSGGAELVTNGEFDSNIDNWTINNPNFGTVTWEQASASNGYNSSINISNSNAADAGMTNISISQDIVTDATSTFILEVEFTSTSQGDGGDFPNVLVTATGGGSDQVAEYVTPLNQVKTVSFEFKPLHATTTIQIFMAEGGNNTMNFSIGSISCKKKSTEYTLPSDLYRFGTLLVSNKEAEQVLPNELRYINAAPLTKPTASRPIYTRKNLNAVNVYPETITSGVTCNYVRKPSTAEWDYVVVSEKALYNATGSTHFELHPSEETYLVIRILELAGVILNKQGLVQIAANEEMQIAATHKK